MLHALIDAWIIHLFILFGSLYPFSLGLHRSILANGSESYLIWQQGSSVYSVSKVWFQHLEH